MKVPNLLREPLRPFLFLGAAPFALYGAGAGDSGDSDRRIVDPSLSAAYYGRVLDISPPRWTACETKRFGITMNDNIQMVTVKGA